MIEGTFDIVGAAGPRAYFEHLTPATLSHGYLFAGPAGVGKKTFARALAHSLLCVTPKRGLLGWCATCAGCTRFAAGTHPDFFVAEGQVKIGERDGGSGFHESEEATARDLVRQLSLHSYAGGKRVFVLGDADFTREAANALLKFFEEPPAAVVLIVTTAALGRVLPTIRSRLVEVTFPLLSEREVTHILERNGTAAAEAAEVAAIAGGSASRAFALLEGEGSTREAAVEWFFAAARGDEADASAWATRPTLEAGLDTVKTLARDWIALTLGRPVPLLARDQRKRLEALPTREPAAYSRMLAALGDAERIARTNVTPTLVADLARIALAPQSAS